MSHRTGSSLARGFSLVLSAMLVASVSCGGDRPTGPAAPSVPQPGAVAINATTTELAQLQPVSLTATVTSTNGQPLDAKLVRWSSLDTEIASVDSLGVVTGLKPGKVRIVAAVGAISSQIELTVHVRWLDLAMSKSWSVVCGIAADSTAYCWGAKLGGSDTASSPIPVEIPGGHHFRAIDVAANVACGIDGSGRVFCWGANDWGQLGDGSRVASSVPVAVQGVAGATLIATGSGFACAATSDGTILCWGHDDFGQIGDGVASTNIVRPPTRVDGVPRPSKLTLGSLHGCALAMDGSAYCWGLTQGGLLGAASSQYASTPLRAAGTLQFSDLAASDYQSCGTASTGGVYCWGLFAGNSPTPQLQSSASVSFTSVAVTSMSTTHTCAVDPSGVSCWGSKEGLGYGPIVGSISNPTHIAGSESFVSVRVSISASCGLTRDGRAFCWGENFLGVLGNGASADTPTPILVADPIS